MHLVCNNNFLDGIRFMMDEPKRSQAIEMVVTQSDVFTGLIMLIFGVVDFSFGMVFAYGAWAGFNTQVGKKRD